MAVVTRHVSIAAPPGRVWALLADIEGQPRWMRDLKEVRVTSPGPIGLGTRAVGRIRMFGLPAEDPIEIDAWDPGRHFGLRHLGRFSGRGDIWLSVDGSGGTVVRWRETIAPDLESLGVPRPMGMAWRLIEPAFAVVLALVFRADLRRLKRLAEEERQEPPGASPPPGSLARDATDRADQTSI